MNRLVSAIEQPISADRRLIIRRALMWYAILPALILRVVGQNSLKTSNTVVKRCYQFINSDYGALINSWESDRLKRLNKPRTPPINNPNRRTIQAIRLVKTAQPRCIRKAVTRITGHGHTSCDNPSVRHQMIQKHPLSTGRWDTYTPAADQSETITMSDLANIMDKTDPEVGTGPRGLHADHIHCLTEQSTRLD
jgi:hypothetical protein